jgi:murein DD-endopeptidase MepM/ murein hydrolase activator NlpD
MFRNLFKDRDIFIHDGKQLKRVRLGAGLQAAGALLFVALVFATIFVAARFAATATAAVSAPDRAQIVRMQREVETMQAEVALIKEAAQRRYLLTAQEVRRLGLDPTRLQAGVGGPFEPVEPVRAADPNFKALFMSWTKLEQLEQGTIAIPSTEPVKGVSLTSTYGVRSDPFRGRAAMHAGIDLAGPVGTPIYATADGTVGRSQWVSGYGNLVELEHAAGQKVKRGEMIALMGSTGRSTGSHLHYEVRIDGKAVNPVPFMQSSNYLQSVQQRAAAAAMGGPDGASK